MIVVMEFDILTFRPIGFYCGDPKISHKFVGDTIPFSYLLVITMAVPLIGVSAWIWLLGKIVKGPIECNNLHVINFQTILLRFDGLPF